MKLINLSYLSKKFFNYFKESMKNFVKYTQSDEFLTKICELSLVTNELNKRFNTYLKNAL